MRYRLLFVVGLFVACTLPAAAQQWDAEQLEVLEFMEGCWSAWTRTVAAHDQSEWTNECRPADDLHWWWGTDSVPENKTSLSRQFAWQVEHIERVVWWDVRPLVVNITGDVAIIMFFAEGSWIGTDGVPVDFRSNRLDLFRRDDTGWSFLGGMVQQLPTTSTR